FFEARIRPLLTDRCHKCHSAAADKIKGGLRLDSRQAILKGGDSGPAVVPADPAKSRLLMAVRPVGDLKMAPDGTLSGAQRADVEQGVRAGAAWTVSLVAGAAGSSSKTHWAFQAVRRPAIPPLNHARDSGGIHNPIDAFIFARLHAAGLMPSLQAD